MAKTKKAIRTKVRGFRINIEIIPLRVKPSTGISGTRCADATWQD